MLSTFLNMWVLDRRVTMGLLLLGGVGVLLFFPLNLPHGDTCLFQALRHSIDQSGSLPAFENVLEDESAPHGRQLYTYMHHYSYLWWVSLLLLGGMVLVLRRRGGHEAHGHKTKTNHTGTKA